MLFRRKAILLIHGFVGGIYDFGSLPRELELNPKYDVFTFTLPAHEKTIVSGVKYNDWIKSAENEIEFLINSNYKTIYVIGHSMGGVIATHLAIKYPQVKKLVLAAPAFRYLHFKDAKLNIKGFNETMKDVPDLFKNLGRGEIFERIQKTPIPTIVEFTKLVAEYQNDIKKVTCPVLTIRGTSDKVVPEESVSFIYENNPSKTNILVHIANMKHNCFVGEREKDIKLIINDFLKHHQKPKKEIINID